ncbi:ATP-dependent zinc metalloprotease FtsH [Eubacterium oxidoreducens]
MLVFIFAALFVLLIMSFLSNRITSMSNQEISYTEFLKMVEEDKVEEVEIATYQINITPKSDSSSDSSSTSNTTTDSTTNQITSALGSDVTTTYYTARIADEDLLSLLKEHDVTIRGTIPDTRSTIIYNILSILIPIALIWILLGFAMRRMGGGSGGLMGVGKSNAKVYVEKETGVTFADVAGQDEAKESLQEAVDFLHNPQKYTDIGAKLPKGALLVGPPGTGKTLLAKAVAGEAKVPFFSMAGSAFVEMFVGVGASRVRDLFKEAQKQAPCIIFIDEIDAIGKSRDSHYGGGNDEREQTLNQLLAEMDGFDSSKGVMILAATNRPEVLDKALLRPGRFDRRIIVEKPDLKGRYETLKVHAKNVLMDDSVDLNEIALATSGAVGSDLANMINEAAINAVKHGRRFVNQQDLFESVELVIAGKEKKDRILGEDEKRIVAYHEVGHALAAALQKGSEPVQKITIVPRTMGALGYVMQVPEEEKYLMTERELRTEIVTFMAGRAAEEIVFDSVTTGASNDIEKATKMARAMVTQYGMSKKFGLMGLESVENRYLDGRAVLNCGEQTAAMIDDEVMKILKDAYEKAKELLAENRSILDEIADYLFEHETITGKQFMKIFRKLKNIPEPEEEETEEEKLKAKKSKPRVHMKPVLPAQEIKIDLLAQDEKEEQMRGEENAVEIAPEDIVDPSEEVDEEPTWTMENKSDEEPKIQQEPAEQEEPQPQATKMDADVEALLKEKEEEERLEKLLRGE